MQTQAQQQLANLDALKTLEEVVGEMYWDWRKSNTSKVILEMKASHWQMVTKCRDASHQEYLIPPP